MNDQRDEALAVPRPLVTAIAPTPRSTGAPGAASAPIAWKTPRSPIPLGPCALSDRADEPHPAFLTGSARSFAGALPTNCSLLAIEPPLGSQAITLARHLKGVTRMSTNTLPPPTAPTPPSPTPLDYPSARTPEKKHRRVLIACRPPATWGHFAVSFASSMGPLFRQ